MYSPCRRGRHLLSLAGGVFWVTVRRLEVSKITFPPAKLILQPEDETKGTPAWLAGPLTSKPTRSSTLRVFGRVGFFLAEPRRGDKRYSLHRDARRSLGEMLVFAGKEVGPECHTVPPMSEVTRILSA